MKFLILLKTIAMSVTTFNPLSSEIITDNLQNFNDAIQQSYSVAKKQLQDGVSVIKEEFTTIYETAGTYIQKMVLPVNNFLKDLTQIDTELQVEITKEKISLGEHNCMGLEENY